MSTVTPNINLTKPASVENFSLGLFNENLDKIDANSFKIVQKNSKQNDTSVNWTDSVFTRISQGSTGIIVALFRGTLKTGYTFNAPSNASALAIFDAGIIPVDMRPLGNSTPISANGVISGSGSGFNLQCAVSGGSFAARSAGGSFSVSGDNARVLQWLATYPWNGNL